jgi:hypothetical protein
MHFWTGSSFPPARAPTQYLRPGETAQEMERIWKVRLTEEGHPEWWDLAAELGLLP